MISDTNTSIYNPITFIGQAVQYESICTMRVTAGDILHCERVYLITHCTRRHTYQLAAVYKLTVTNLRDTYGARKFVILDKDT